jgi:asparagine synthase (glutamine-hydrolysing)
MNLPVAQRYLKWMAVFDSDLLQEVLTNSNDIPNWNRFAGYFPDTTAFSSEASRHAGQAMVCDGQMYLPGDLNTKTDRAGMSVGLELRCPFQDHKVMELAYSLPTEWRIRGRVSKYILRQACGDLLPPAIQKRPKMGFGVPVGTWFRNELRDLFCDTVLSPRATQRGYFANSSIEKLLWENDNKQEDHGHRLWALLMLELWHCKYIDSGKT